MHKTVHSAFTMESQVSNSTASVVGISLVSCEDLSSGVSFIISSLPKAAPDRSVKLTMKMLLYIIETTQIKNQSFLHVEFWES